MKIRPGGPDDLDDVLAMLDQAVAWLTEQGRTGQWGSTAFSEKPERIEQMARWLANDDAWIAEIDGESAGAMTLSPRHLPYVPAPGEPELYVRLLVTARRFRGHGVGGALLDHARAEAARAGVGLLRVDCYAGGGGKLVDYYTGQGFTPVSTFSVGEWPGQLLAQHLPRE